MIIRDNKGKIVNYNQVESVEVKQAKEYIREDDRVLELGARYGGVAVTTNNILKDKDKHWVVEPDPSVWDTLENNKKNNNCKFNIIKGTISKQRQRISGKSWSTHTIEDHESNIPNHLIPLVDFNVLIADCEGAIEQFYDENKNLFKGLRLILLEKDRPNHCNYDRIFKEWREAGFKQIDPERLKFHTVWIKE
jgi:hypothetical protein